MKSEAVASEKTPYYVSHVRDKQSRSEEQLLVHLTAQP